MKLGTLVKHKETGKLGVAVTDPWGACSDSEIPVVWEGTTNFFGTSEELLEDIGPENAIPNPKKCGAGRGAECCIFLVAGQDGFECQRFGTFRNSLIFKKNMVAQRQPTEMYPNCMKEEFS